MIKATTLIAAAFALSAQAAMAGPLTVSDKGEKSTQRSEQSLVSSVLDQMTLSMSALRSAMGGTVGKSTEYKSAAPKQCEHAEKAHDEEEDGSKAKKAEPVGPEPIYFGF